MAFQDETLQIRRFPTIPENSMQHGRNTGITNVRALFA